MGTKVQRKFYIAKTLADALRIEAARRNESQSSIVERAIRKELVTVVQVIWRELRLLDVDGRTPLNVDEETCRRLLHEYRTTGGMHGAFFAPLGLPHEDPDDASTWGPPSPDAVDWEGFDGHDDA